MTTRCLEIEKKFRHIYGISITVMSFWLISFIDIKPEIKLSTSISPAQRFHSKLLMIKRDSDLYQQHLQYEIRDYFLPEKIGKHALIWDQYQKIAFFEPKSQIPSTLNCIWYWKKSSLIVLSIAAISVCVLHILWLTSKKCKKSKDSKTNEKSTSENSVAQSESTAEHAINNIWVHFSSLLKIIYNIK